MATVKVIPARARKQEILRVAAYCRVSSDSADQQHSYAAQVLYYTKEIQRHVEWKLVDIYTDDGITGTSMIQRKEFQRMLSDCRDGKIDRILVKSLSRFSRNTKDCLTVLRELSQLGVSVSFEKERIDTATLTIEMMVSVFGAIAQQESMSISQNQRMSYQRRMEKGEFITCKPPYGYRIVNRKELEIVPEEAELIRWIFHAYLNGKGMDEIAADLTERRVKGPDGSETWSNATVQYILTNEKYIGDSLCQKEYTDAFPFVEKRNRGERPQYYVENTHPAILSRDAFQRVQRLRTVKAQRTKKTAVQSPLSGKLVCGECGAGFIHRTSKRGESVWCCRKHDKNAKECPAPRIKESEILEGFVSAYHRLKAHEREVLEPIPAQLNALLSGVQRRNPELVMVNQEIAKLSEQIHGVRKLQTMGVLSPDLGIAKLSALRKKLDEQQVKRKRLQQNDALELQVQEIQDTIRKIQCGPDQLMEFDAEVFENLVQKVRVTANGSLEFCLYGGIKLEKERT